MLARRPRHEAVRPGEGMVRRGHGQHLDLAHGDQFEWVAVAGPQFHGDPEIGPAIGDELLRRPERLDIEAQGHGREGGLERGERIDEPGAGHQHARHEAEFGFETAEQAADHGPQRVDAVGDGAGLRQHGPAAFGELGPARRLAVEQG
ncbi:hypothetical protein AFFFEF_01024 [Methylorubrum extorquens]